jgi:hypothetical protein
MAGQEFVFEVYYGGKIDRQFMSTHVGADVDVYKGVYDGEKLSFFEVESIVEKYGYKSRDLLYYLLPGSSKRFEINYIGP